MCLAHAILEYRDQATTLSGYVYEAYIYGAVMAGAMGEEAASKRWCDKARFIRDRFQEVFWQPDIGMYALALDGNKKPCAVRSSNAGHCLYSGIATQDHADRMAPMFVQRDFPSDCGIGTIPKGEARFNPMSYHNGAVWPHDNALVAEGLARYGFKDVSVRVLSAIFEASNFIERNRLPEFFCGFDRKPGVGPTLYPVACDPQAWAASSAFQFIQTCLGIQIDGARRSVVLVNPMLPPVSGLGSHLASPTCDGFHGTQD